MKEVALGLDSHGLIKVRVFGDDREARVAMYEAICFFFSSRRRHTSYWRDWSSDVCSSDLANCLLTQADEAIVAMTTAYCCVLRSEEHTSELQSRQYLVCRLLLEKKKKK